MANLTLRPAAEIAPGTRLRRDTGRGWGWTIATVLTAALVALPVLVVLAHLVVPSGEVWRHLAETVLPRYLSNSLWLMLGVGAGTLVIGTASAWVVTMCRFPGRGIFEWALLLPLAVPAYVIAYSYTGMMDFAGPVQTILRDIFGWQTRRDYWFPEIRSLGGAIAMLTLVLYPYVYMLGRAAFMEQSVCVLEASRTLGSGPWRSFSRVALPLARPALAGGMALALMETLNDFGTVSYFAVDTFTTGIYRTWLGLGEPAVAAQLAAVLLIFVFALLLLERVSRGGGSYRHATNRYRELPRLRLGRTGAVLAFLICLIPVFLGFILPAVMLIWWSATAAAETMDARFFGFAWNSFLLASLAAATAVGLSLLMAYGQKLQPKPITRIAVRFASMGYAVPGSIIAVGVLLPLTALDRRISDLAQDWLGVSPGLVLTGSIFALVFAYLVRFLAVSFNTVEASLARVTPSMEGAARTLGCKPLAALRRVHLPIMRGSILTAGLLVFVDVMKELPATLIVRPFNFDTLAVRAYALASDERLADAAAPSLAIVAVGILPVILLSRAIAVSRPGGSP